MCWLHRGYHHMSPSGDVGISRRRLEFDAILLRSFHIASDRTSFQKCIVVSQIGMGSDGSYFLKDKQFVT